MSRFGDRMQKLARLVDQAGIRHFAPEELVRHTDPDWPHRTIYPPPERLLEHIVPTLEIADRLREEWGGAVRVLSGYRCPVYNDLVIDGAADSQHMYFRALDLQPADGRHADWIAHCERIVDELRSDGQIIGLGRYPTFCHIDTGHYDHQRDWSRR